MSNSISITLKKSPIDKPTRQKATLKALGLNKINQTVTLHQTPQLEGMIKIVNHLVEVKKH